MIELAETVGQKKATHLPIIYRQVEPSPRLLAFEQECSNRHVTPRRASLRVPILELREMRSLLQLGPTVANEVSTIINDCQPVTFNESFWVPTLKTFSFKGDGKRYLCLKIASDERLVAERQLLLSVIGSVVGTLPPEFDRFQWATICGIMPSSHYSGVDNKTVRQTFDVLSPVGFNLGPAIPER